jgi:redox-sensitive bicupin YhaK (pirin superfamily)
MIRRYKKEEQAYGEFNLGEITENKPLGFPGDGGQLKPYSNIFYWAHAKAYSESTIGLHPHKGFEIITIVLEGIIEHYDTSIDRWIVLKKGAVQVIQAGSGISHSEKLHKNSSIFQIWLDPNLSISISKKPRYRDYKNTEFNINAEGQKKITKIDGGIDLDSEGIEIYEWNIKVDQKISLDSNKTHSFYVRLGRFKMNEIVYSKDDFIKVDQEKEIQISIQETTIIFGISSPKKPSYLTYG